MATRINPEKYRLIGEWQLGEKAREELVLKSAWATKDDNVIGAVYYFEKANSYTYNLSVLDKSGRYQRFFFAKPIATARLAEDLIRADLEVIESGEKPAPTKAVVDWGLDLFAPGLTKKPNPKFLNLRDGIPASAAKKAISEVARWYQDRDGNFVKDFQTTGYDARLWELYLFASFAELGFAIENEKAVPDFRLKRGDKKIFVEAVTANPSNGQQFDIDGPPPPPPKNFAEYIENDMPQKFGSPLRSKVAKEYWSAKDVARNPFIIAIADFHAPASMIWSHTALSFYLYGVGVELNPDSPHFKKPIAKQFKEHVVGNKRVPSNFFGDEAHKHISAIMFSNAGTQAKFNRMGVLAGYGNPNVKLVREGGLFDLTPGAVDAIAFRVDVEDPSYEERWSDGLEIYHNPNALNPLDPSLFPTLTHFYEEEGELVWHGPEQRVLYSRTNAILISGAKLDKY